MKEIQKQEAREMRQSGKSLGYIAKELDVSKASVSLWTKDIVLTLDQKESIKPRNYIKATYARIETSKIRNNKFEEEGRNLARLKDPLHMQACMLYWAEGSKGNNSVKLSNTDIGILKIFVMFINKYYPDSKIRISIDCYLNNGVSLQEIEDYWINELGVSKELMCKTRVLESKQNRCKKNTHKYGICKVIVHDTRMYQNIYGSIKEYQHMNCI